MFDTQKETRELKAEHSPATIGFVLYYPFQFYVYKNIYDQLKEDSEFIVDFYNKLPEGVEEKRRADIMRLLDAHRVRYRIVTYEDHFSPPYLKRFFSHYRALVSVWERGCIVNPHITDVKKIRLAYGAGKELTMVRPSGGMYDLTLSYGLRDTALYSHFCKTVMVGNPKFDDWFRDSLDQTVIQDLKRNLDAHKKTILYVPTHSDLSSIDSLAGELTALRDRYNIIAKVHYHTAHGEPDRMKALTESGVIIISDDTDLLPLLKVSDVALSDNSSAIFDVILADKPIIVADFWDSHYLDKQHKKLQRYFRGMGTALTYSGSIEQVIKRDGRVLTIQDPHDVASKIEEGLRDIPEHKAHRAALREELFAYNDGKCAERAANAIRDCISSSSPEKTILYHAFEAYKKHSRRHSFESEQQLYKKIAQLEDVLEERLQTQGVVFSVIVIRGQCSTPEHERAAMRSIIEQDFPQGNYEIIPCNMTREECIEMLPDNTPPTMPQIGEGASDVSLSKAFEHALAKARGEYVALAFTDIQLPSDWLTSLYLTYQRFPETAGVGGYVLASSTRKSAFDEYRYHTIGRQLNVTREKFSLHKFFEVTNQLFNQNPAGDLCAMSYRKDRLPRAFGTYNDPISLGLYIKLVVMCEWPITFVPKSVSRLQKIEWKEFLRTERARGFFYRLSRHDIERMWSYEPLYFFRALGDALRLALLLRIPKLFAVLVIGKYMQFVGRIRAISYLARLMAKSHKRDMHTP